MAQTRETRPLAAPRQPPDDPDAGGHPARVLNPFGSADTRITGVTALTSVEQQRQIAEVQSRMVVARSFPREMRRCMDAIINECTRPTLAEKALYAYQRGGTDITGPSIRLMEAIARHWGNIASGIKEIARHGQYSECVAYAWDLETGYYDERQFQIRHWRDVSERRSGGAGGYALTDERDIYELIANFGQRRKRATLQAVIPGDVIEAAVEQCEITLKEAVDITPEGIKKMLDVFQAIGVSKEQIEARCQRRVEAIRPAQFVQLRKIYTSINDGMSTAADWFDQSSTIEGSASTPPAGGEATTTTQATQQSQNGAASAAAAAGEEKTADKTETATTAPTTAATTEQQPRGSRRQQARRLFAE